MKLARKLAAFLAATLAVTSLAACSPSSSSKAGAATGAPDISKEVNLVCYLWGDEGVGNKAVLAEINKKLKADINATIEVKYIGWADVSTKYPLLFASGQNFDMAYASPTAAVSFYTLAGQNAIADISDILGTAAPKLKAAISEQNWAGAKYNGKIYGVPCSYTEFTPYGYAYRTDLQKKYGLPPITSIPTMEAYMDKVVENESFPPLNGNSNDAINLYRMMVASTDGWINAPGIPLDQLYLVATSTDKYKDIIDPAFTQQFEDWAVKMRQWSDKGYFPKDILSSQLGAKDNMVNGLSAGFLSHMADWTGNYGALQAALPNIKTDFYAPAEASGKILKQPGVNNTTVISSNSKNKERALMAIEKLMTDKSYYDLLQYGIEGKQWELKDGVVVQPASFNKDTDAFGFAGWALRNDTFNMPMKTEDPRRYELNTKWNKTAKNDPFVGFSLDTKNISTELSSIASVNAQLGTQIMLGKTKDDPKTAVAQYRQQLKQAGIDKVIAEVKSQLKDFTSIQ